MNHAHSPKKPTLTAYPQSTWILGILIGFVVGAAGWALANAVADPTVVFPRAQRALNVAGQMVPTAQGPRVEMLLGDSLTYESGAVKAVVNHLRDWQEKTTPDAQQIRMVNASAMGFDIYSHYLISSRAGGLAPERVLIAVNLGLWSRKNGQQPELAALFPAQRWHEALLLPLHEAGVTMGDLLTNRLVYLSGGLGLQATLQTAQIRLQREVDALAQKVNSLAGTEGLAALRQQRHDTAMLLFRRPDKAMAEKTLAPILRGLDPDDGRLQVLAATIAHFRSLGAQVLVFIQPLNHEHLGSLGVYDGKRITTSIDQIRQVAVDEGADFLDLHVLLPDAAFHDSGNHLAYRHETRPAMQVARELQPWLESARARHAETEAKNSGQSKPPL